jgi:hypothetical protein
MSSKDFLSASLPPHELALLAPRGTNVSSAVSTATQQPKRVSITGIHDISLLTSQNVNSIPLNGENLRGLGVPTAVVNPMIVQNPVFSEALGLSSGNHGGWIQQSERNAETIHYGLTPSFSGDISPLHAFPHFNSMLGTSLLRFQRLQRAEMAFAHSHSATNDAVLALLRLGHSTGSTSKNMVITTDQAHETCLSPRKNVQPIPIEVFGGAVKRPLPKNPESSSAPKTASTRPKNLSMPSDVGNVNSLHRFVRAELLELFEPLPANEANRHRRSRVGLRCVYCTRASHKQKKVSSTYSFFPKSIEDIYVAVCTWQRIHFAHCKNAPKTKSQKYQRLKEDKRRGKKAHWAHSAYELGLRNVSHKREGIMWCQETKDTEDSVLHET